MSNGKSCGTSCYFQRQVVKERLQVIIEDSSNLQFLDARLPYKYNLFKPVQICQPLRGNEIFVREIVHHCSQIIVENDRELKMKCTCSIFIDFFVFSKNALYSD